MLATTSPVLQMLNEKIDVLTLSPIERKLYESRMKLKSDITTISETQFNAGMQQGMQQGIQQGMQQGIQQGMQQGIQQGMQQGMQQGIQQGMQQGMQQGIQQGMQQGIQQGKSLGLAEGALQKAFQTARNLLGIGLSIENIAKATGLTIQEVEKLNS